MTPEFIIAILTVFLPYASTIGSNLWGVYIVKKCKGSRVTLLARDQENQVLAAERLEKESSLSKEGKRVEAEAQLYLDTEEAKNSFIKQVTCGRPLTIILILPSILLAPFLFHIRCEGDWQKWLILFLIYFDLSMLSIGAWQRDRRVRTRLRKGLAEYISQNRVMNAAFLKAIEELLRRGKQNEFSYLKIILDKYEMEGDNYWKDLMEHVLE